MVFAITQVFHYFRGIVINQRLSVPTAFLGNRINLVHILRSMRKFEGI